MQSEVIEPCALGWSEKLKVIFQSRQGVQNLLNMCGSLRVKLFCILFTSSGAPRHRKITRMSIFCGDALDCVFLAQLRCYCCGFIILVFCCRVILDELKDDGCCC